MLLNWINPEDYSFNSFLLLERFQIRLMLDAGGWGKDKDKWRHSFGIALRANPVVMWYLAQRCPERSSFIEELAQKTADVSDEAEIRKSEAYALRSVEDFIIYTTPTVMAEKCDFILGWEEKRLFDLCDFANKTVLDVGAGSGRLSFAAAKKAAWVYASEPVGTLREFMRDKIAAENIKNVRVLDGLITDLPFPDKTFDIVMTGHVIGDFYDEELEEISRVCKPGGWLLDCPGDSEFDMQANKDHLANGWTEKHYVGSFGKDVYCYSKQVQK